MNDRQKILEANTRLVYSFTRKYAGSRLLHFWGGKDELVADLWLGYVRGVDAWISRGRARGKRLATYVFRALRWQIARDLPLKRLIYVPRGPVTEKLHSWRQLLKRSTVQMHGMESVWCQDALLTPDFVPDVDRRLDLQEMVARALRTLDKRQAEIVRMRCMDGRTLAECGRAFGMSMARVGQILRKALRRCELALSADMVA